jgi:uncharacterized membrane protein YdjX (TVP38/TMEM64 family)
MGVDTECDLVIEAGNDAERAAIANMRNWLLGHHCGLGPDAVASMMARCGSLVATADRLSSNGHRLCQIEDCETGRSELTAVLHDIIDPKKPLSFARIWSRMRALGGPLKGVAVAVMAAALIAAFALIWSLMPSGFVSRDDVQNLLSSVAGSVWAPLLVLCVYLIGGMIAFPVMVLIVATAAIFGPWLGIAYAMLGVIASALLMYFVGAWVGRDVLHRILGSPCEKVRREIDKRGVLAVAAIRLVPVAPFTLVNLMAGACRITLADYVAGTLIGMFPGLITLSVFGYQVTLLFTSFSGQNLAVLTLLVIIWSGIAVGAQTLLGRWRRRAS